MPIRARHSRPPSLGSVPSTETSPLSHRRYPSRISTVVVLPAPFGPSSANTSPWKISRSTPSTAIVSPYDLRSPLTRTLVVESMPLASAGAGGNTTTGRPDLPSTIRWTESGFAHAADRVRQGVDHVAGPDRRFPAGDPVTPPPRPRARAPPRRPRTAQQPGRGPPAPPPPRRGTAGGGGGPPPPPARPPPPPRVATPPVRVGLTSSGLSPAAAIPVGAPLSSTQ